MMRVLGLFSKYTHRGREHRFRVNRAPVARASPRVDMTIPVGNRIVAVREHYWRAIILISPRHA